MTAIELILFVVVVLGLGITALMLLNIRGRWMNRTMDAIRHDHNKLLAKRLAPLAKKVVNVLAAGEAARKNEREAAEKAAGYGRPSAVKLIVLPPLAAFWLFMFVLQVVLDIQITRGLYPDNLVLALILGTVAAIAISGFALAWTWQLGHEKGQNRQQRTGYVVVGGLVVLVIMVGIVVAIAPFRSQSSNLGRDVIAFQKAYENAKSLQEAGALDQLAVDVAKADLVAAQVKLEAAKNIDRSYAVIVPTVEIILSFPAVAAGEMLFWFFAARKARKWKKIADGSRQVALGIRGEMNERITQWRRTVTKKLLRYGQPGSLLIEFDNTEGEPERAKLLLSFGSASAQFPTATVVGTGPPNTSTWTPGSNATFSHQPTTAIESPHQRSRVIVNSSPRPTPRYPAHDDDPTNPM